MNIYNITIKGRRINLKIFKTIRYSILLYFKNMLEKMEKQYEEL